MIIYWMAASAVAFIGFLVIPKQTYAGPGEYCCPSSVFGGDGNCLLMLAPCDIRQTWIGAIALTSLILSVLVFIVTRLTSKK